MPTRSASSPATGVERPDQRADQRADQRPDKRAANRADERPHDRPDDRPERAGRAPKTAAPRAWRRGEDRGHVGLGGGCPTCDRFVRIDDHTARAAITSPEQAAAIVVPRLAGADRERCLAALLDTKHRLLTLATVSVGSLDHTFMAPREVFRDALVANAAAIVLAHNHPSGDPEPSRDDEAVTRRLTRAGELIGIEVLDHLVVGDGGWVSLARRGSI